ncbi:MAG: phenylalanine--tRNA ligase subunit alpha [Desulfovibrio sp. S3730MH75]|nr:MAG: phenylalanine--tRNA ligase subunit alpha [Desulfovibrio sp. S3730MH75]
MSDAKSLLQELEGLVPECNARLDQASSLSDMEELRVDFLGRKGRLAKIMSGLPALSKEDKPVAGKKANEVKTALTDLIEGRQSQLERAAITESLSRFDPTMPGRTPNQGSLHPVTLVMDEICDVLIGLGFEVATGPEVENDWYNFEALNIPPEHPARDMQDTLYISDSILLRTHTSPLQIRTMMERTPPLAAIAPGKVYRRDSDITHTPMFHQIEGFLVGKDISMANLRGTITAFIHQLFGPETEVRFRPSFFPFTEPGAEVDISCVMCGGTGSIDGKACRVCKQTGWVEILGCGMLDPNVMKAVNYDTEIYSGFAFGVGIERVAMLKYGIGDLRMFFENDIRFLQQFS